MLQYRLLLVAFGVLDPRKWRRRVAQLGGLAALGGWVWFRAVQHADVDRAVRDARRAERRSRIEAGNLARELRRYEE